MASPPISFYWSGFWLTLFISPVGSFLCLFYKPEYLISSHPQDHLPDEYGHATFHSGASAAMIIEAVILLFFSCIAGILADIYSPQTNYNGDGGYYSSNGTYISSNSSYQSQSELAYQYCSAVGTTLWVFALLLFIAAIVIGRKAKTNILVISANSRQQGRANMVVVAKAPIHHPNGMIYSTIQQPVYGNGLGIVQQPLYQNQQPPYGNPYAPPQGYPSAPQELPKYTVESDMPTSPTVMSNFSYPPGMNRPDLTRTYSLESLAVILQIPQLLEIGSIERVMQMTFRDVGKFGITSEQYLRLKEYKMAQVAAQNQGAGSSSQ